ncbi:hypothetical protein [uncultured Tateyamaria sp.]|uniref:hypothetical protein n=1 Tax=uncultured Tateyamaria sp. TaxID=455651 RepID=UPI002622C51B|nr:hypothetical protein [uncultured Tateyamaria sp.]
MRRRTLILIFLAILLPTTVLAQRFFLREIMIIPVRPIDTDTFEVIENDGAGGTQMWCAAGKYVRDYQRQRGGSITVLTPRASSVAYPGRKSVIFTTKPVENSISSTSQGVRTAGQTFSTTHANALCRSRYDLYIKVRVLVP